MVNLHIRKTTGAVGHFLKAWDVTSISLVPPKSRTRSVINQLLLPGWWSGASHTHKIKSPLQMKRVCFSMRTFYVSALVAPGWHCHYSHATSHHRRQGLQLSMETLIPGKWDLRFFVLRNPQKIAERLQSWIESFKNANTLSHRLPLALSPKQSRWLLGFVSEDTSYLWFPPTSQHALHLLSLLCQLKKTIKKQIKMEGNFITYTFFPI